MKKIKVKLDEWTERSLSLAAVFTGEDPNVLLNKSWRYFLKHTKMDERMTLELSGYEPVSTEKAEKATWEVS